MPLIKRDIENIQITQQVNIQAVKDGVDRIYDIAKWLIGAMAVSIITLVIELSQGEVVKIIAQNPAL